MYKYVNIVLELISTKKLIFFPISEILDRWKRGRILKSIRNFEIVGRYK